MGSGDYDKLVARRDVGVPTNEKKSWDYAQVPF